MIDYRWQKPATQGLAVTPWSRSVLRSGWGGRCGRCCWAICLRINSLSLSRNREFWCQSVGKSSGLEYRSDLQGLRALAVGLVLASHFGVTALEGGFLGVDVFFVLSGFLITGLLVKEWQTTGGLDLPRFYARRIRRLFPAMLVTVLAVFIFAVLFLPGAGLRQGLAAAPYALTWVSNFFFDFRELGYFESLEGRDFFLHTWSLAVEEQFYLIWPVLLLVLLGRCFAHSAAPVGTRASWGMVWLASGGFALCVAFQYLTIDSAFYQMPARIWEFAVGGWCSLFLRERELGRVSQSGGLLGSPLNRVGSIFFRAVPAVGIFLILASAFWIDGRTSHPGLATTLPVFGTALVIMGGAFDPKVGWLSSRPLVWLGDRSYSIYLWHWPVILVCQFFVVGDKFLVGLVGLLLTVLLSILSYSCVEYPFWKGRFASASGRLVLWSSLCALVPALVLTSLIVNALNDPSQDPSEFRLSARFELPAVYSHDCDDWYKSAEVVPCKYGEDGDKGHVVYIGDSIGLQWFSAVEKAFVDAGWSMTVFTKSGCPIVDRPIYYERLKRVYKVCEEWRHGVLAQVPSLSPQLVIVGSSSAYDYTEDEWVDGSRAVLFELASAADNVVVLAGTPRLPFNGPDCIERELVKWGELPAGNCTSNDGIANARRVEALLRQAAAPLKGVSVAGFADLVCPGGVCRAMADGGQIVFRDDAHLADSFVRSNSSEVGRRLKGHLVSSNEKQD